MRLLDSVGVLLIATVLAFGQRAGAANPAGHATVKGALDSVFSDLGPGTPGCVASAVERGKLVYDGAFGMADIGQKVPMRAGTVLEIGSLSKEFTAASILLLAQQGKLSLEDPVRKYVPALPIYGAPVTVGELMHHTSGVRDVISLMQASGISTMDKATQKDAMAMIERQRHLNFRPGTEWEYSNSGYVLLAAVVESVTGESLPEFEEQNIFKPLGMSHTVINTNPRMVIPNRARSYSSHGHGKYQLAFANWVQYGDGAVNTTAGDFALWMENFDRKAVGGATLIQALETPGHFRDGRTLHYAGGLFVDTYRGLERMSHPGVWQGFRAEFEEFPTRHLGLVVLCNGAETNPKARADAMAKILLKGNLGAEGDHRAAGAAGNDSALDGAGGWYVSEDNRQLWHVANGKAGSSMGPAGNLSKGWSLGEQPGDYVSDVAQVRISGTDGRRLTIEGGGARFSRLPGPSAPTALRADAGTYFSNALQVAWGVSVESGHLTLHVRGANPNRLDADRDYAMKPQARGVFRAGPYVVRLGTGQFWLFVPRASGIRFVRTGVSQM